METPHQLLIFFLMAEKMKIVLNTILAKEKGMGGFNVALNFFNRTLRDDKNEWFYFVSQVFDKEAQGKEKGIDASHYYVFHPQPDIKHYYKDRNTIRRIEKEINPDIIYSILAPSYHFFKSVEVMRCANAWTVVGGVNKYAWRITPLKYRIRYSLKAHLTHMLMRRTKYFITQSIIAKNCILRTTHTSPDNVCVVSNVLADKFQRISVEKRLHTGFNMVYASSPAIHKDYLLLPQVASILIKKYRLDGFKIHVTIPENTNNVFLKLTKQYNVEDYFINHGFMNHSDLIEVYLQSDLGLFPSLLETFSGTLLEYMYFKLPIVASDLDFNREVAGDAALYFHPHDAEDMAEKIFDLYSHRELRETILDNANEKLAVYSNNSDKFSETLEFMRYVHQKEGC